MEQEYILQLKLISSTGRVQWVKILLTGKNNYECRMKLIQEILAMSKNGIVCFLKKFGKPVSLFYEDDAKAKNYEYFPIGFSIFGNIWNTEPELSENYKKLNVYAEPFSPNKPLRY